jgi:hypothetical protein
VRLRRKRAGLRLAPLSDLCETSSPQKVAAERQARLGGEIVAADFHLRQITMLEVLFDLAASRPS